MVYFDYITAVLQLITIFFFFINQRTTLHAFYPLLVMVLINVVELLQVKLVLDVNKTNKDICHVT